MLNLLMLQAADPAPVEGVLRGLGLDSTALTRIGLRIALIWLLAWIGDRALRMASQRIVAMVDDGDDSMLSTAEKRGNTIAQLVRSVGRVLIFAVALLLSLNIFINIGPLLAGAGVAGLAISFGAQSLVKDVLSGFFILMEDQFTVGDSVEIGGLTGVVERMTLRIVSIRDLNGVLHTIPNGSIATVSNRTRGWSRAVVEIGVGYREDVDRALAVFADELRQFARDAAWHDKVESEPDVLGVESLADSAVQIRIAFRTLPGAQWNAAREFRRRMKLRLDREGIEIPFPQRTVHHVSEPSGREPA